MLDVEFAALTDCGRVRDHNEDYLGSAVPDSAARARSHGWLFALADGVGGHEAGEVASRTAVDTVLDRFRRAPAGEALSSVVKRAVQAANEQVYAGSHNGPVRVNMATTLVVCALRFDRALVAHVGDSRCYRIRAGQATLLTRDHTLVNEQVRLGVLSSTEAAEAPTRHVLSRSLGADMFVNVDAADHPVLPGDVLVLCSDGLYGAVTENDIAAAAAAGMALERAAERLVTLANERDGGDNISVQLIRVRSIERMGMYRGRPYKLR
ncbi:MAG TPA: protein phosphatase 2C domain-containing protein [Bryobacteraceae bacterium]|nr:protein phosphatase 2C domain-containing protein [Bryobacteraceae bacterium]